METLLGLPSLLFFAVSLLEVFRWASVVAHVDFLPVDYLDARPALVSVTVPVVVTVVVVVMAVVVATSSDLHIVTPAVRVSVVGFSFYFFAGRASFCWGVCLRLGALLKKIWMVFD
jgi:hypothetical protein